MAAHASRVARVARQVDIVLLAQVGIGAVRIVAIGIDQSGEKDGSSDRS